MPTLSTNQKYPCMYLGIYPHPTERNSIQLTFRTFIFYYFIINICFMCSTFSENPTVCVRWEWLAAAKMFS